MPPVDKDKKQYCGIGKDPNITVSITCQSRKMSPLERLSELLHAVEYELTELVKPYPDSVASLTKQADQVRKVREWVDNQEGGIETP